MRIQVDYDRCEGHGLCAGQAPGLFELDDDGELSYRFEDQDVPADQEGPGGAAVTACPVAALRQA